MVNQVYNYIPKKVKSTYNSVHNSTSNNNYATLYAGQKHSSLLMFYFFSDITVHCLYEICVNIFWNCSFYIRISHIVYAVHCNISQISYLFLHIFTFYCSTFCCLNLYCLMFYWLTFYCLTFYWLTFNCLMFFCLTFYCYSCIFSFIYFSYTYILMHFVVIL